MKIRIIKKGLPKAQTGYQYNGRTLDPNNPYDAKIIAEQEALIAEDQSSINAHFGTQQTPKLQAQTIPFAKTALSTSAPQSFTGSMPNIQPATITEEPARRWHSEWDDQGFDTDPASPLYQEPSKTKKPLFNQSTVKTANKISDWADATQAVGSVVDYFGQNKKLKDYERAFRQNQFDNQAVSPMFRGNYNVNTGRFRDDVTRKPNEGMFQMGGEENFANTSNMIKIRIVGKPENLEFKYGGQNGYGLDLGQRRVQTEMPESKADSVSNTIQEVPRYAANIEAEGGETVYGDLDGDGGLEHMKISGKRHSEGGVPLNVPEGSFIFSDTPKMKIKDPEVLKYFGLPAKKGGYTPAEIAKRYDINKYKAIIEDETSDELSKNTAQLMVSNYTKKLSALSVAQEQMKGFPQGMPAVAQAGKEQTPMAEYGGYLPKAQNGRVAVWDEEEQKQLQDYLKLKYNVEIPVNARDTDPKSQRFTLPSMQTSRGGKRVYGDEDWTSADNIADFAKRQKKFLAENPNWDPAKVGATEKFQKWYDAERTKKGMKPYFGKGQAFQKVDDKFGEYTFSAPDLEPGAPVIETPQSPIGYKCLGLKDGSPNVQSSSYKDQAAMQAAGAYATAQEAALNCPGEITPNEIPTGEKPKEGTPGFLTPDKLSLLTAGLIPPQAYLPYVSDLPYRQGDLALEDWLSKAQQRQQTFNTASSTLGQYQPGTAMASNLSFLAGQTGEGVSQDIAQVDSRNVDRANQYMAQELQRKTANDAYNANARDKRWEGFVTTKQNLDNARRKYLTGITSAANNAWANRMYLDMINKVNPIYNVDPRSGLSFFKEGYDRSKLGFQGYGNTASPAAGSMSQFPTLKRQYMGMGMTEANAEKEALAQLRGGRVTYSDTDNDGLPNTTRTTMAQQMPGMYRNAFGFNMGGVIGPWK